VSYKTSNSASSYGLFMVEIRVAIAGLAFLKMAHYKLLGGKIFQISSVSEVTELGNLDQNLV